MAASDTRSDAERKLDRFLRRFAYVRRDNVEAFAERFAQWLKAGAPPRDPRALLPRIGIAVERGPVEPPARARWEHGGEGRVLVVSEQERPEAQAFAAWREVFCLLASRPSFPTELSQGAQERLANRFASVVLMPRAAVLEGAQRFRTNPEALVEVLASRFGVSLTAMRKRLYELEILRPRSRTVHVAERDRAAPDPAAKDARQAPQPIADHDRETPKR